MSRRGLLTAGTAVASAVAVGAVPTTAAAAPSTNGVIYGVEGDKDLLWYRHEGRSNGTPRWANNGTGRRIGNGWNFEHVLYGNQRATPGPPAPCGRGHSEDRGDVAADPPAAPARTTTGRARRRPPSGVLPSGGLRLRWS
jgi:hypothetical protein